MKSRVALTLACLTAWLAPTGAWACAACYGQSDAPIARGMNWGIFSLLVVIVAVLLSVAGFFIYLARRSARTAAVPALTAGISPMKGFVSAGFSQRAQEPAS